MAATNKKPRMTLDDVANDTEWSSWKYYICDTLDGVYQSAYGTGKFAPVLPVQYMLFSISVNSIKVDTDAAAFGITMGIIRPEKAKEYRKKRYFADAALAGHNTDTREQLTHAAIVCDWTDIDLCRTLDGHYMLIHGTTWNGKTIAETNLADLGLTYNYLDLEEAIEICRLYGCTIFCNFRETTAEQIAEVYEKIYSAMGRAIVGSEHVLNTTSPLYGSNKFGVYVYGDTSNTAKESLKAAGIRLENVYYMADSTVNPATFTVDHECISLSCVTDATYVPEKPTTNCFLLWSTCTNILNDA